MIPPMERVEAVPKNSSKQLHICGLLGKRAIIS